MAMYWREISGPWGGSDPFGLVDFPKIVAWFYYTEPWFFRTIGYPGGTRSCPDRNTLWVGGGHFFFIGPAAYGDRVMTKISLEQIGERTLHWNCIAANHASGDLICEGRAVRVYARIQEDGNLKSFPIPDSMRKTLEDLGTVDQLGDGLIPPPPGLQPQA